MRSHPVTWTDIRSAEWQPPPNARRPEQLTRRIGSGSAAWQRASDDLLHWRIKTRSGFSIDQPERVRAGARLILHAGPRWLAIREPIEVVEVIESPDRVGFSYRALPGHPVNGEEAFIVTRVGEDVFLSLRSVTSPSDRLLWRVTFPALRVIQRVVRWRYLRSLS